MTNEQVSALLLDLADYVENDPTPSRHQVASSLELVLSVSSNRRHHTAGFFALGLSAAAVGGLVAFFMKRMRQNSDVKPQTIISLMKALSSDDASMTSAVRTIAHAEVLRGVLTDAGKNLTLPADSLIRKEVDRSEGQDSEEPEEEMDEQDRADKEDREAEVKEASEWLAAYLTQDADKLYRFRKIADQCLSMEEIHKRHFFDWVGRMIVRRMIQLAKENPEAFQAEAKAAEPDTEASPRSAERAPSPEAAGSPPAERPEPELVRPSSS